MEPLKCHTFRPAAVLRVTGEDHHDFLQNQGTADLSTPPPSVRYSLWLDHKGIIQGDAFVVQLEDEATLLFSHATPAAQLMDKFERHIIADDVALHDETDAWKIVAVEGPDGCSWLGDRALEMDASGLVIKDDLICIRGRRLGRDCLEFLLSSGKEPPFSPQEMSPDRAEALRIHAGIPSIPRDVLPGNLNPVEARMDSALSFTKGCYLGQEVVARVHRLQRFSRRLVRVHLKTTILEVPAVLTLEGKEVGCITSAVREKGVWTGIANLKGKLGHGEHDFDGLRVEVSELDLS